MTKPVGSHDADGLAALGICEAVLLALTDLKVLSEQEVSGLLTDVITTHQQAALTARSPGKHKAVVEIVRRILEGKNGVRG